MLRDHNDQIALKHSLDYGRSSEIYHYSYIVIIRPHNYCGQKYPLISPMWPRYPKSLFLTPVYIYESTRKLRVYAEMKYNVF